MARQVIDGGGWFETDSAVLFGEMQRWDGRNHISRATGSQWDHEQLYHTRNGQWVLNEWSQYQGSLETHTQIDEDTAIDWLVAQECWRDEEQMQKLPAAVQRRVEDGIAAVEV